RDHPAARRGSAGPRRLRNQRGAQDRRRLRCRNAGSPESNRFSFRRRTGHRGLMDFRLSESQLALQETARKFARTELPSLAETVEATSHPVPPEWLKRYAEMGFLGVNTAEEFGGLGLPLLDALIVMEEFAKISVG